MKLPREFVMTISRADFARLLPAAVGHEPFAASGDGYEGTSTDHDGNARARRGWRIDLHELPHLRLGSVSLARLQVRVAFLEYSAAEAEAFMARFELYFRRGGG